MTALPLPFWDLIDGIRQRRRQYERAGRHAIWKAERTSDWLVAMNAGEVLATGSAEERWRSKTCKNATLEEATSEIYLPASATRAHQAVVIPVTWREVVAMSALFCCNWHWK